MATHLIRSALAIAVVAVPLVSGPAESQTMATTLSPAYYDPHWKVVVVPYQGAVPAFTTEKLTNPARVYYDFKAQFKGRYPAGPVMRHPSLVKWAMAPRGAGMVRLTLTFKAPMDVRVINNARRNLLVFVPQTPGAKPAPAASAAPARPSASPSVRPSVRPSIRPSVAPSAVPSPMRSTAPASSTSSLGVARYDARRNAVVVPFNGLMPTHMSETLTSPPRVYFDFQAGYNGPGTGGTVPGHPSLVRWVMAPRDPRTTRVTLTFSQPTKVAVTQIGREILLTPAGPASTPAPAATATPAPPRATTRPVATPRPVVTPAPTVPPSLEPPLIPGPESDRPVSPASPTP